MTTAPAFKTAERQTRTARPALPGRRAVLVEQVRATGLALRGAALVVAAGVVLITLVAWMQSVSMGVVLYFYEWPTLLPALMGALLPVAVWNRDDRSGHGYLWTLPVDRRQHAFAKVFAGWVWLMAGIAAFALWRPILTLAAAGRMLPPETLHVLTAPLPTAGPLDPASLQSLPWAPGPVIWLVPFTAATATYLLISSLVLGSRRPLRWVIGIVLTYGILGVATDAAGAKVGAVWIADAPINLVHWLVESRYGLDAVVTARTGTLSTIAFLTSGQRAMVWRAVPDLADWRIATLLWTSICLVALWAAVSRHREGRRI